MDLDPLYIAARRVLLDALFALDEHRSALVLVGAQAVYLRAGDADLEAVAPFTTDADLGIDAAKLGSDPDIARAMTTAGFTLKIKSANNGIEPGSWLASTEVDGDLIAVEVDLMVPEMLAANHGKRDARLPEHSKNAARWAPGLEAAVMDNDEMLIESLEPLNDRRRVALRVAGSAALFIAKAHKLGERVASGRQARIKAKDAGDVLRLMRGPTGPQEIGKRLRELSRDAMCRASVQAGIRHLEQLFATPYATGVELAVNNLASAVVEEEIRTLMPAFTGLMLETYRG
ncbi:hypothetical protein C8054_24260 [Micromonospora sp. RP3T]|nr:hypothetical protein C8054_24260 [Micromonospora sp. RP3T]